MKTLAKLLSILLIIPFLLLNCEKDDSKETPDNKQEKKKEENTDPYAALSLEDAKEVNIRSAVFEGKIDSIANIASYYSIGVCLYLGDTVKSKPVFVQADSINNNWFHLKIDTLKADTSYYYSAYFAYATDTVYTKKKSFNTLEKILYKVEGEYWKRILYNGDTLHLYGDFRKKQDITAYFYGRAGKIMLEPLYIADDKITCAIPKTLTYNDTYSSIDITKIYFQRKELIDWCKVDFNINTDYISFIEPKIAKPGQKIYIAGSFRTINRAPKDYYIVKMGDSVSISKHIPASSRLAYSNLRMYVPENMPEGKYAVTITSLLDVLLVASDSVTVVRE